MVHCNGLPSHPACISMSHSGVPGIHLDHDQDKVHNESVSEKFYTSVGNIISDPKE